MPVYTVLIVIHTYLHTGDRIKRFHKERASRGDGSIVTLGMKSVISCKSLLAYMHTYVDPAVRVRIGDACTMMSHTRTELADAAFYISLLLLLLLFNSSSSYFQVFFW